jgi:hypothetical protein
MSYFYILHTREYINRNENIYKIGRTNSQNGNSRFIQYPKDSIPLFVIYINHIQEFENRMIQRCRDLFRQVNVGNEYFEGELSKIIEIAMEEINTNKEYYLYSIEHKQICKTYHLKDIEIKIKELKKKLNRFTPKNKSNIFEPNTYFYFSNAPKECQDFVYKLNLYYNDVETNKKLGDYLESDIHFIIKNYFEKNHEQVITFMNRLIENL